MVQSRKLLRARGLRTNSHHRVVLAGDSLFRGGSAGPEHVNPQSAAEFGEIGVYLSSRPMRLLRNAGIGGNTSTQLRARFLADVIDYDPSLVPICIGTNDFQPGFSDSSIATLFDNVEWMVLRCLDAGVLPMIVVPPIKGSHSAATNTDAYKYANAALQCAPFYYRLAHYYGLPIYDALQTTVNPATGAWAYSTTASDTVHPEIVAELAMGQGLATALDNLDSPARPYLAPYSLPTTGHLHNILQNGSFARGTIASGFGWGLDTTNCTNTQEDPPTGYYGKTFKAVKTIDTNANALLWSSIASGWQVGDTIQFNGRFKASDLPAATSVTQRDGFSLGLQFGGSSAEYLLAASLWRQEGDFEFSVEGVVPSGTTGISPYLHLRDLGTYEINNLTLISISAMDRIWTPGQQS